MTQGWSVVQVAGFPAGTKAMCPKCDIELCALGCGWQCGMCHGTWELAPKVVVPDEVQSMSVKTCESCQWWANPREPSGYQGHTYIAGDCRRRAPDHGRSSHFVTGAWPTTRPDAWCGDYEQATTQERS